MPPPVSGVLLVVVALIFAGLALDGVLGGWIIPGLDYLPLRHAAEALLAGDPVFGDPAFVYPPAAAVVLLPAALGSPAAGFAAWVVAGAAALLLAALLIAREAPRPYRPHVFAAATLGLLGGVLASRSLFLGNLSELLVPVAVGVLLCFHRGRWLLGCALLAASLLVKPLLAPLVLIPLLHRRWAALLPTMLPGAALLLLSMLLVPGGRDFRASCATA
ncbi:glycosyltransferase 87 family protein [Actinoplanes sp. CA-030573]|uniref:glycosyltransferase 87 family protein n=1 Tax=Actinoplanes sp. CA-030573 TaxID=3239898 RepID=UPI003D8F5DC5